MKTIGKKITSMTIREGCIAQMGTGLTVLTASALNVTVSTTHCLIGAIAGIALTKGIKHLNTKTFNRIILSWVITFPFSALFSALIFYFLSYF